MMPRTDPFGSDVPTLLPQDHSPHGRWVPNMLDRVLARMHWEPGTSLEPTDRAYSQEHEHGAWTRGAGNFMGWALYEPVELDGDSNEER